MKSWQQAAFAAIGVSSHALTASNTTTAPAPAVNSNDGLSNATYSLQASSSFTRVAFVEGQMVVNGTGYKRVVMQGNGPQWTQMTGIDTLYVPEGEQLAVEFINLLQVPELIHIHGQIPPTTDDGFPYVSSAPMPPLTSTSLNFSIPIDFRGTYFMHSHVGLHYANGMKTPVVIAGDIPDNYPNATLYRSATDVMMFVEEACSMNAAIDDPTQNKGCFDEYTTYHSFHAHAYNRSYDIGTSTYLDQDLAVREAAVVFNGGAPPSNSMPDNIQDVSLEPLINTPLTFEQPLSAVPVKTDGPMNQCKPAAHTSIVSARMQLTNRLPIQEAIQVLLQPGELVRLRIVNAASMASYYIDLGGLQGFAIAVDGHLIYPDKPTTGFWISVSQRLDVLVQLPSTAGHYLISAITQFAPAMRSGLWLVTDGNTVQTTGMSASTQAVSGDISSGSVEQDSRWHGWYGNQSVDGKAPVQQVTASANKTYVLNLTGATGWAGINNYNYQLPPLPNVTALPNPHPIEVGYGDHVCIQFVNHADMAHPFHLHGHKFQVAEIGGIVLTNGPIRDTVVVPAGSCNTSTLCFDAIHPGVWALHCHLEFHLIDGMLTTVQYEGFRQQGISNDIVQSVVQTPVAQAPISFINMVSA